MLNRSSSRRKIRISAVWFLCCVIGGFVIIRVSLLKYLSLFKTLILRSWISSFSVSISLSLSELSSFSWLNSSDIWHWISQTFGSLTFSVFSMRISSSSSMAIELSIGRVSVVCSRWGHLQSVHVFLFNKFITTISLSQQKSQYTKHFVRKTKIVRKKVSYWCFRTHKRRRLEPFSACYYRIC